MLLPEGCEAQPEATSLRVQPDALWWWAAMLRGLYVTAHYFTAH